MENTMQFKTQQDTLIVYFKGDIDHQNTLLYRQTLIDYLDEHHTPIIILDFKDVSFIDSSGIGMILGRYNQVSKYGGHIYFSQLSEPTRRLFELSGLLRLISTREVGVCV